MTAAATDKPTRTLIDILGHEPSPALRRILAALRELPREELHWLKIEGIRREQLDRIVTVEGRP